jgi:hypothetical protein
MESPFTETRELVQREATARPETVDEHTDDDVAEAMFEPTQPVQSHTWAVRAGLWGILEPLDKASPIIQLKSMTYHIGRLRRCPPGIDDCAVIDNLTVSESLFSSVTFKLRVWFTCLS